MNVLSYGGGTNSTALIIEMERRGFIPDAILFADTGGERPETYRYIDVFNEWLAKTKMPQITIVREKVTLEDDCLRRKALPSVAYGFKTCSQRWKARPQERWIKSTKQASKVWEDSGKVIKIIGIDAGEDHRAKKYDDPKYDQVYPLVEWGIERDDCVEIIKKAGLPQPGKSSCFFCPNMRKTEITTLKYQHPELMARALEIESNSEAETIKGLGRTWSWASMLATDDMFPDSFNQMPCGCYDG